jgi:hypothetical protein
MIMKDCEAMLSSAADSMRCELSELSVTVGFPVTVVVAGV